MPTPCPPLSLRPIAPRPVDTRHTRPHGIRSASPRPPGPAGPPYQAHPSGPRLTATTRSAITAPPAWLRPPSSRPPGSTNRHHSARTSDSRPAATDGSVVRLPHVVFRLYVPRSCGISCICIRQIRWLMYRPPQLVRPPQHEPCVRSPPCRTTPDMPVQLPPVRIPVVRPLTIRHPPVGTIPVLSWMHQVHNVGLSRILTRLSMRQRDKHTAGSCRSSGVHI